jgi:hypothetical protein
MPTEETVDLKVRLGATIKIVRLNYTNYSKGEVNYEGKPRGAHGWWNNMNKRIRIAFDLSSSDQFVLLYKDKAGDKITMES